MQRIQRAHREDRIRGQHRALSFPLANSFDDGTGLDTLLNLEAGLDVNNGGIEGNVVRDPLDGGRLRERRGSWT